ncbi:PAS domain S-box protein [Rhodoferax sp. PAMC 29310]|uniref:PAS domain S-box protein n=1 Tax=Rhodoferax sp. PAMC 29310 TaxID=2822760 RepID=UPI001B32251D|nr:PAS domain S-box protein [Rhodoferax sp. PAMC 29310]
MRRPLRHRLLQALSHPLLWGICALVIGLLLTVSAYNTNRTRIEAAAKNTFNADFDRIQASMAEQFQQPLLGLRAAIGLQGSMRRENFRAYVAARDMNSEFPGVRGFGYVERVLRSDLQKFEAAERADQAPNFTVKTEGSDEEMYIIKYIEPLGTNLAAQGLDVGAEAVRREAVERAISSGVPSLTGSITLVQDGQQGAGFLYLMPVYSGGKTPPTGRERRAALTGIFYSPLVANELLKKTANATYGEIDFELYDAMGGDKPRLVFSSLTKVNGTSGHIEPIDFTSSRAFHQSRTVFIGGNPLVLRAGSSVGFDASIDRTTPRLVATVGAGLSLILAYMVWLVLRVRDRDRRHAKVLTRDLARMARVIHHTSHMIAICGVNQKIEWTNAAFNRVFELKEGRSTGLPLEDLFSAQSDNPENQTAMLNALAKKTRLRQTLSKTNDKGDVVWLDIDLQTEHARDGQVSGYVVVASDITQQVATNQRLAQALRDSEALMSAIDQHSLVSIADPAGNITYVNDLFSDVSGYPKSELIGSNDRIVKSNQQDEEFWARMWATISSGYPWRGVVCNQTKEGSLYWVDTLIAPYVNDSGQIDRYISIRTDVTAAVLAQQALAKEREHLERIITGTNAGTWALNAQTEQVEINELWASMVGYTKQELEPVSLRTWQDLCEPDDLQKASAQLAQHLNGEIEHYDTVLRMRHRLGHWVWIQTRGTVSSRTSDGKAEWVSGIHLDISQQKEYEEKLQRTNTVMQSILDNIPVGLSAFDGELNLIAKNQLFQTNLDFPDELFLQEGTSFERIIRFNAERGEYGPGDHEQTIQTFIERARHPELHVFERVRPSGMALEVRGAPMPGGGFVTTYADISLRKQAEAEIARTTNMLQSVLDAATEVGVITIGLDNLITLFNKGAERMLGYAAEEVVGRHTPELIHDPVEVASRATTLSSQLGRAVTGFEVLLDPAVLGRKFEWTYQRKDRSRFPVGLVVTELTDPQGKRTGYLGVSQDISVEKDYQNGLREAKDTAEAATAAKGQFLANMSHEIRTPMNAILGMLTLLQQTTLTARQLDYAYKAHRAATSLLGLLNDILDFSKIEAGKMALDLQPFRIDHMMRDLSVILSANVGSKSVEILFDIAPDLPKTLVGDALRLQQVLINLTGNAIKFTEAGEVVVQIRVLSRNGADTTLRISVRDSGIGISPENQTHIFDGFSQAEASTTRRFGGTGLGLSISKRFVELMGGSLSLESALGQGSTFHFTITLRALADPVDAEKADRDPALQQLSVLVVDDNATARDVLREMAQSWGWTVDAAESGASALQMIDDRDRASQPPYQVIFVDWMMPEMDGWQTIQQVRQKSTGADAPVIIMVTAHGREMLSHHSKDEQARLNAFLVKPVTASMLFDAVAEAKSGRSNLRTRARSGSPADREKRLKGLRLLVVEDNVINQQVAQELLSAEGASVELASNGQLGVDAVREASTPFDAVLMDLQMPVMDGYAAARAIRAELGLAELPVIALTANAMSSDREACLAAGMNDHIGKPIDLQVLVKVLLQYTRPSAGSSPSSTQALPRPAAMSAPESPHPQSPMDVSGALARLSGNTFLYLKVLQSYLVDLAGQPEQLKSLLAKGDLVAARRLMHTFKGLSATIGANGMSATAKAMENALQDADSPPSPAMLAEFRDAADDTGRIVNEVAQRLVAPIASVPDAAAPFNQAQFTADLMALHTLLMHSDMQALEAHAQLRKVHAGGPSELQALNEAMETLDFEKSMVECTNLIQNLCPIP